MHIDVFFSLVYPLEIYIFYFVKSCYVYIWVPYMMGFLIMKEVGMRWDFRYVCGVFDGGISVV